MARYNVTCRYCERADGSWSTNFNEKEGKTPDKKFKLDASGNKRVFGCGKIYECETTHKCGSFCKRTERRFCDRDFPKECRDCRSGKIKVEDLVDVSDVEDVNFNIDYYGVLELTKVATRIQVKQAGDRLVTKWDDELRNKITARIRGEVTAQLRTSLGREPKAVEIVEEVSKRTRMDSPECDREIKRANAMLRFVSEARGVLFDNNKKKKYDRGVGGVSDMFKCYNHISRDDWGHKRTDISSDIFRKDKAKMLGPRLFCSDICLKKFIDNDGEGMGTDKKDLKICDVCKKVGKERDRYIKSKKTGKYYCGRPCYSAGSAGTGASSGSGSSPRPSSSGGTGSSRTGHTGKKCSQCGSGSPRGGSWVKFNTTASIVGGDEFCSENCLFNNLSHKYPGKTFPRCVDCLRVSRKNDWTDVIYHTVDEVGSREARCKNTCYDSWLRNKRNWFINHVLENISGWKDILTESERVNFRNRIGLITFGKFKSIRHEVERLIDSRSTPPPSGPGSPHTDPLAAKKNLVIREIKRNLDEDVVVFIEELDSENQDWEEKIQNASDGNIIEQIKTRVIDDIKNKRNKKNLEQIRSEIINKINNYLSEEPKVKNSELSDISNWESLVNQATSLEVIEKIRDSVLASILNIKKKKESENDLNQLIDQAREAIKAGNWIKLDKLLEKINLYQNTTAYFNKQEEIKNLGKKLIESSADGLWNYQDNIIDSLDGILSQDPPVDISELSESNQNYIEAIKDAKSQDEIDQIKNGFFNNVNEVRTEKKVDDLLIQAQKVDENDDEEISRLRQEIVRLMKSDNKYEKVAWEKNKHKFEKLSWFSSGESSLQNDTNDVSLLKVIGVTSLVVLPITALAFVVFKVRRRRLANRRK